MPDSPKLPLDVMAAVDHLIRVATGNGFAFIGGMVKTEPYTMAIIGNIKNNRADVLHKFADILEEKQSKGLVVDEIIDLYPN